MKKLLSVYLVFVFSLLSSHAATIDTTPTWGGQDIGFIGTKGSKYVGQIFTVSSSTRIDQITFYLAHEAGSNPLQFNIQLRMWDISSNTPVGGDIFISPLQQTLGTGAAPIHPGFSVEPYTVNTGGIELLSGQSYIAFLSTINATFESSGWVGYAGDVYNGGQSAFVQQGASPSVSWTTGFPDPGGDLAVKMSFNIPEPSAYLLTSIGVLSLMRRTRRFLS
ncbi:MAG: hypothetical protein ABI600_01460 [Luteolibacter sp.]